MNTNSHYTENKNSWIPVYNFAVMTQRDPVKCAGVYNKQFDGSKMKTG